MLRKAPRFHLLVALILALGIGANTSICTPVNAALLRPLPYHDSSRLVVGNDEATGNVWASSLLSRSVDQRNRCQAAACHQHLSREKAA
jgi:hypothetical protein